MKDKTTELNFVTDKNGETRRVDAPKKIVAIDVGGGCGAALAAGTYLNLLGYEKE